MQVKRKFLSKCVCHREEKGTCSAVTLTPYFFERTAVNKHYVMPVHCLVILCSPSPPPSILPSFHHTTKHTLPSSPLTQPRQQTILVMHMSHKLFKVPLDCNYHSSSFHAHYTRSCSSDVNEKYTF